MDSYDILNAQVYESFSNIDYMIPKDDTIVLFADFNARVGSDCETLNILGKYGVVKITPKV